jgi:uncharacterized protein (TIGR00730 family)
MPQRNQDPTLEPIKDLLRTAGADPTTFEGSLLTQMIQSVLKLVAGDHDSGQLKLINSAVKEMRYAYEVFNRYRDKRKIAIFGSARTPETHADYIVAREFSAEMARQGWMVITGAGDGIMKAGHEGPQREASFGLSIRLPFETTANEVIEGDPKLINFRYFFTRKLMFMTHADAVAVLPGGFGTQDELFETLTLVQTGKSNVVPIVLIEGEGGVYWKHWDRYVRKNLLDNGWINEEDPGIYVKTDTATCAVEEVTKFYRLYHSSRYVGQQCVMRVNHALTDDQLEQLNDEFAVLVKQGRITQTGALDGEEDHLDLPRVAFEHTKHNFGLIRAMIDRINSFAVPAKRAGA